MTSYAPLGYPSTYNPSGCDVTLTFDSPENMGRYSANYDHGTGSTYGDRLKAWFVDALGSPMSFYTTDLDLDTGLPTANRDIAGAQTSYEYDSMARLRWEEPQASNPTGGAWVEHQYFNWSTSDDARVENYYRPNGSTTGVLARDSLRLGDFGQPFRAKTLLASGSWNQKKTMFSVLGFPRWVPVDPGRL